jgi:hypothetical protein
MIKSHYNPRGYLKNFCHGKKKDKLFVYDKTSDKSWITNIGNVACEKGFYNFPELRGIGIDTEFIEHHFAKKIEPPFYKQIEHIVDMFKRTPQVDYYKTKIFEENQKKQLSLFIVYQLLRTKEYRQYLTQLHELVVNEAVNQGNDDEVILEMTKEQSQLLHIAAITDNEVVQLLAYILCNYIWVIGVNNSDIPLYTSDNPVVISPQEITETSSFEQLLVKVGTEVAYPVNSNLILLLFERTHYKNMLSLENRFHELNEDVVKEYNALQVTQSYNQVFCIDDNFDLAREVCKTNPQIADKGRIRITLDDPFAKNAAAQVYNKIHRY